MPRLIKPLTATQLRTIKPKEKKYKLSDGGGLFLLVNPNGSKLWRLNYRFNNKAKEYAIGVYPSISLARARQIKEELKSQIASGIDINEKKKSSKKEILLTEQKKEKTFFKISMFWWNSYKTEVSENYHNKLLRALELYIFPYLKSKPIEDISRLDIIKILDILKEKELIETANRVLMLLNKIFMYSVTYEHLPHNIIADIDKKIVLGTIVKKHYPTFTKEKDIKALLLSIDDYQGDFNTKKALQMLPYVFVRSFNIRHCEWAEIDLKANQWIIPANKMKTKTEFILPLPNQVIEILKEMNEFSGDGKYVFPTFRAKDKPMSDNTMIGAIRRMGFTKDEFVPHGFRAMFSTLSYEKANNEDGHNYTGEVIEALLAHKEQNQVKGAYNRAKYIEPMRGLIQWYADYLDSIKKS